jgi:hypothetical protein
MIIWDGTTGLNLYIDERTRIPWVVIRWRDTRPDQPLETGGAIYFIDGNSCNGEITNLVYWPRETRRLLARLTKSVSPKTWVKAGSKLINLDNYIWNQYNPNNLVPVYYKIQHIDNDPTNHQLNNLKGPGGMRIKKPAYLPIRKDFLQ